MTLFTKKIAKLADNIAIYGITVLTKKSNIANNYNYLKKDTLILQNIAALSRTQFNTTHQFTKVTYSNTGSEML